MEINGKIGEMSIQEVLRSYPEIGGILGRFDIGCVTCRVGVCLLKDVVAIHGLAKEDEKRMEREINELVASKGE